MNSVHLMGRLVADPELRTTTNGTSFCNFSLAKNTYLKGGDQRTDYFDCVAWNGTAERLAQYCHKGDNIVIVGYLQNNNYTTAEGEKRYSTRIVVRELYFAGRKNSNASTQQSAAPQQTEVSQDGMTPEDFDLVLTDEEVPFT